MPLPRRTRSFVPVTNIVGENAATLRRSKLFVVEPHSRSIAPELSKSKRFSGVTGRYSTRMSFRSSADDLLDHHGAEVQRIADRLSLRVEKCERRRVLAMTEAQYPALVDLLQRPGVGDDECALLARNSFDEGKAQAPP